MVAFCAVWRVRARGRVLLDRAARPPVWSGARISIRGQDVAAQNVGGIDFCDQHQIFGWTDAASLGVYVNGECCGQANITAIRGDHAANGIAGARGFDFAFPTPLWLHDRVTLRLPEGGILAPNHDVSHVPRLAMLVAPLDLSRPGLEFGPLHRPSPHQILMHLLRVSEYRKTDLTQPEHAADLQNAIMMARHARDGAYVDVHCNVFTPASFVRCYDVLRRCGLVGLRLDSVLETERDEFFVRLSQEKEAVLF
jgi:hypothetical protein